MYMWMNGKNILLQVRVFTILNTCICARRNFKLNLCMYICYAWYLDDGVVAGPSTSVQHVVCLLQDLGPSLGLHLNPSDKCELFGQGDLSVFPSQMNKSCTPNLIILGAPIGEVAFCSSFIASKRAAASTLLSSLVKLGSCDPQMLSFCYACVVGLPNWSMLHVPLPHPWHWMSCIPLMSRSDAPSQSAKLN